MFLLWACETKDVGGLATGIYVDVTQRESVRAMIA